MQTGNGLARRVHIALIVLLVLGVAGSFWMSVRAQAAARDAVAEQAGALVDSSLTLVFDPEDLQRDLPSERIRELTRAIDDVVFDPSDFESVVLYASNGEILFSTEDGNIGQQLTGERSRISAAFRGEPQTRLVDGRLIVTVGLHFPSGAGTTAAVELSRPADDIASAAGPWRTNMFFLAGALILVVLAAGAPMLRGADASDVQEVRQRVPVIPGRTPGASAKRVIQPPQPGM
ncbi:MAG TPA: hypothetical protein VFW51_03260, partial [Actinomycetota bacterium]|nr:hypothetical protein [Actinomycetota bacterium]